MAGRPLPAVGGRRPRRRRPGRRQGPVLGLLRLPRHGRGHRPAAHLPRLSRPERKVPSAATSAHPVQQKANPGDDGPTARQDAPGRGEPCRLLRLPAGQGAHHRRGSGGPLPSRSHLSGRRPAAWRSRLRGLSRPFRGRQRPGRVPAVERPAGGLHRGATQSVPRGEAHHGRRLRRHDAGHRPQPHRRRD